MDNWYMLTVVGQDRPGIVAHLTRALFDAGANLGEAAMARLGGNFTIMLMVNYAGKAKALTDVVEPVVDSMDLRAHVDPIEGRLHEHLSRDVAGSAEAPIYVMHIEGHAAHGIEVLRSALGILAAEGIDAHLEPIDTLIG